MTAAAGGNNTDNTVLDAERDVLRRIGLLSNQATAELSGSEDEMQTKKRSAGRQWRWWTRTAAIGVARGVIAFARYPVDTATMQSQLGGAECTIQRAMRGMSWQQAAVGFVYQWSSGKQMELVAAIVQTIAPQRSTASFGTDVLRICVHYGAFAVLYGAMRQSIVARLAQHLSLRSLVVPAAVWIRDLVFWRRPRGAVFGVYVRDVVGNYMEESLRAPMINALVSKGVFSVYMVMLRGVLAARRAATDVVATLGRITRVASKREADDGADADAAADVEVVFMAPDSTGRQQDRQQQRSQRQSRIGADRLAQQHAEGELLVYMRFVSALVSGIVTRAVVYPVDALVVRLMADETALTAYGYTGFFDCLARSPRGLASLYAGFTRALVADMVFGWAAAELAHVLCKTAWIQT